MYSTRGVLKDDLGEVRCKKREENELENVAHFKYQESVMEEK